MASSNPFVSLPLDQALMFFMDHPTVVATYFAATLYQGGCTYVL